MKLRSRGSVLGPYAAVAVPILLAVGSVRPGASVSAELPVLKGEAEAALGATAGRSDGGEAVRARETEEALRALAAHVTRTSAPEALGTAVQAYYRYRSAHPERVRNPYLYFVDLGLGNHEPRGWVFDMDDLRLVEGPFTVAHGRGSSRQRNGVPTSFSNRPGSNASSLGLYLAQETYRFSGKSGGRRYSSVGLRMRGESGRFNDAALSRGVVAHGAPYVTPSGSGRSEGCPAMEPARAERLLPMLADGGVAFIYSPNDQDWLGHDPWLQPE